MSASRRNVYNDAHRIGSLLMLSRSAALRHHQWRNVGDINDNERNEKYRLRIIAARSNMKTSGSRKRKRKQCSACRRYEKALWRNGEITVIKTYEKKMTIWPGVKAA